MKLERHKLVTREVDQSPDGAKIGAFFDLDKTLVNGFSGTSFFMERWKSGDMPVKELAANFTASISYLKNKRGFSDMLVKTTRLLKDMPESKYIELGEEVFEKSLVSEIFPEARALVKAHQNKGHTVAIVSSALPYQIRPFARYLGIDIIRCTQLEVKNGLFTGNVIRPTCWGEGKAIAGRELSETYDLDLDESFFYSDSHEDLPLLEAVGKPRPLNADEKLAALARDRNWPTQTFTSRGKPDLKQVLRTAVAYGSMPIALIAGLPTKWLSGSARQQANTTNLVWNEIAGAAVGLDLRIEGQQHLWSHRPAMFLFNHQSGADTLIVGSLLQRDFSGVVKKEAESNLLAGPFLKAIGSVFIDREDKSKALEALEPAVEALRNDISMVVSPEGTRSLTEELGPFKKGAFHMAMQAGVPIVPIVIHNAIDVLPRGASVFRPATVEVEILPPVATQHWSAETIDEHVALVRGMYLDALGQAEPPAKKTGTRKKPKSKPRKTRAKTARGRS